MNWEEIQNNAEDLVVGGYEALAESRAYDWASIDKLPKEAGVSAIYKGKELLYVGEAENIHNKFVSHHDNPKSKSIFRRNLAEVKLGVAYKKNDKGRKVPTIQPEQVEVKVQDFIQNCTVRCLVVELGRTELKEYIIKRYSPILNKK